MTFPHSAPAKVRGRMPVKRKLQASFALHKPKNKVYPYMCYDVDAYQVDTKRKQCEKKEEEGVYKVKVTL